MKVILVRHGAYTTSPQDPSNGLSPEGFAEVHSLLDHLKEEKISFSKVLASPKKRAQQTAEILAEDIPIETTDLLDGTKDPQSIFHALQAEIEDVLVVTHNPFVSNLSSIFGKPFHFHTAGCVVFEEGKVLWSNT